MFQSTILKRAARLAAPTAVAATATIGAISMTSSTSGEEPRGRAAWCEDKEESVLSMLGDIQSRVSDDDDWCVLFLCDGVFFKWPDT